MTHNVLDNINVNVDLAALTIGSPVLLQQQALTAVLLALGSNYHAKYYLRRAREFLATLGVIQLSTAFQNPDFTASLVQPKPDYTNQCIQLSLHQSMTLRELQPIFKDIEKACDRKRLATPSALKQVTMDIDILLIKSSSTLKEQSDEWIIMADRHPFKAHECAGVAELLAKNEGQF